ncbi:hypothetical protein [Pseudomonas phage PMBT14]|uniref:Uncharacterized protein n=1 Tax=Pseudomonas phage PMBT14 TaxID=2059855 RepID=A0A2I6PI93_9CAUD|nr:hypothetical protein HWB42_gp63 [Pseudomonas phage PMBT14]AUM59781.1 hypothetical protein [Pseudomonas phage PMBT14]
MNLLPELHELTPDTLPGPYQTAFGIISVQHTDERVKVRGLNPFTRRSFMMWIDHEGMHLRSTKPDSTWWDEWEKLA